jgi:hypothetical protein
LPAARVFPSHPANTLRNTTTYAVFAQFLISRCKYRTGHRLIETRGLTRVVDAVGLLARSKALPRKTSWDYRRFGKFLAWMLESKNGREESAARNNHGTYYDLQLLRSPWFLGKTDLARDTLQHAAEAHCHTDRTRWPPTPWNLRAPSLAVSVG